MLLTFTATILVLVGCAKEDVVPECTTDQTLIDNVCVDNEPDPDVTAPIIAGHHNLNFTIGDVLPNYLNGITATDDVDGDITSDIIIDTTAVDLLTAGEYEIFVSVTDSSDNEAAESFMITVTEAPIDYELIVTEDLAAVVLPTLVEELGTSQKLSLTKYTPNGTSLYWSSSNTSVISNNGFIMNPTIGNTTETVTLTVTASNGDYQTSKTFDIDVEPFEEISITSSSTIPFENCEDNTVLDVANVDIYFADNGALPYIDIETFLSLIDETTYIDTSDISTLEEDKLLIEYNPIISNYNYFSSNGLFTPDPEYKQSMEINFTLNTVTVSSYSFFTLQGMNQWGNDYGDITVTGVDVVEGTEVTIPFSEYNFDFIIYSDDGELKYLIPFHIANLLFTHATQYKTYYNGDKISGGTYCLFIDNNIYGNLSPETVLSSSLNGEEIPYDIRLSTYYMLALSLDYFSEMKAYREIESFKDRFSSKAEHLITSSDLTYYAKFARQIEELDDLHAHSPHIGYYASSPETMGSKLATSYLGPTETQYRRGYNTVYALFVEKYNSEPFYRLIDDGKTAVIHFYGFEKETPDIIEDQLKLLPESVENVVLDITLNSGGDVASIFRIIGLMTDDPIVFHTIISKDNSSMTYTVEVDQIWYDYNWYILTSNASFSASTGLSTIAKENGVATILGQDTFGGGTALDAMIYPCGFITFLPGNYTTAFGEGNSTDGYVLTSVEHGIEVDIPMLIVTDDEELINKINEHQSN